MVAAATQGMNRTCVGDAGPSEPEPLRIGVSSCLLGCEVRFDGQHKRNRMLLQYLAPHVEFVPVCPEVELGLGIPREAVRLVDAGDGVRLLGRRSGRDLTDAMHAYARQRAEQLRALGLSGYVLKSGSPSCGLERVRVYDAKGAAERRGRGCFAAALTGLMPLLPVEEEGRLKDPGLRESFLTRIFAYRRLTDLFAGGWSRGDVVAFHSREKLLLLAHDPNAYRALGRLVAGAQGLPRAEIAEKYRGTFMAALATVPSAQRHANALDHMRGFLKHSLDPVARAELAQAIAGFRAGVVPRAVPLALLRYFIRAAGLAYLGHQTYLAPYPAEMSPAGR